MSFPYPVPPDLLDLLQSRQRFLLCTHVFPDNDGFGSMLAMGLALEEAGKDVSMIYEGDGPPNFELLPGFHRTIPLRRFRGPVDVVMLLDCHHLRRIGPVASRLTGDETVVVVDHHPRDDAEGDGTIEWVVEESAATACLVQSLIHAMDGAEMDEDKATCLYVALLTDTGGFRFGNTTSDSLLAASDLARHGAEPAQLAENFLHRRKPQTLRLLSKVLETAQYRLQGRVVFLTVDQPLLVETGGLMTETEGFVNFFTSAEGVSLVAMFKEDRPDRWRVSLRANDHFSVHEIAARFGGGGHRQAAGFETRGDLSQLQTKVLAEFESELQRSGAEE